MREILGCPIWLSVAMIFPSCMDAQKSDGLRCRKCSDHFQGLKLHLLCNLHLFIVLEDGDEGIMKVAIKSHHIDRPVQDT